jgi:hypothetical protein
MANLGSIEINVRSDVEPMLEEMRALALRIEAAAAASGQPIEGAIEGELVELRPLAAESSSSLGLITGALVAGAALAGSSTRRVTRRTLIGFGFLRSRKQKNVL